MTDVTSAADDENASQGAEEKGGRWTTEPGRLFALTDGVFAIAITLLALDVKIADNLPDTPAGFREGRPELFHQYGVFLLAFFITSQFWQANHEMLRRLKRVDSTTTWYTIRFLAGICSLPVAATLLLRFASSLQALAMSAALLALTNLLHSRLFWYISDPARGLSEPMLPEDRFDGLINSLWNPLLFLLAIPLGALLQVLGHSSSYAPLLWLLLRFDDVLVWLVRRVVPRSKA